MLRCTYFMVLGNNKVSTFGYQTAFFLVLLNFEVYIMARLPTPESDLIFLF